MYEVRHYTTEDDFTLMHKYNDKHDAREKMGKLAMLENNASYVLVQLDGEVEITLQKISNTF